MKLTDAQVRLCLASLTNFWREHFPESQGSLSRGEFLAQIGDAEFWKRPVVSSKEMAAYQDAVSACYGVYEPELMMRLTMTHLLGIAAPHAGEHMVDVGCGPGHHSAWWLTQDIIPRPGKVTLVDLSPAMLERAKSLFTKLGIADKAEFICANGCDLPIRNSQSDCTISLVAIHWTTRWQKWLEELFRISKRKAPVFVSCSHSHPRSGINATEFAREFRQYGQSTGGFVQDPQIIPGQFAADGTPMMAMSNRIYGARLRSKPQGAVTPKKKKRKPKKKRR